MSIVETPEANGPRVESYRLRLELKEWEKSFAEAHSGRKAGREDIKQHPDIGNALSHAVQNSEIELLTEP